jgi:bifunctional non-homologous end joining protein LigD
VSLERYRQKRDFARTPEPSGEADEPARAGGAATGRAPVVGSRFVVQRHRARRLHYDFRLEIDGVLASWAVPKGPSLDPAVRRAAIHVEDHPLDYFDFEGTIPAGEYGAGDVIVWDWGTFEPEATQGPGQALADGELKLALTGSKLNGRFTLVRTRGWPNRGGGSDEESWLLIKKRDPWAMPGWDPESYPRSVKTGRTNDEVAAGLPALQNPDAPDPPARSEASRASAAAGIATDPMPSFIEPMAATLTDRPFSDPDWLFEVKWDGYRVQAHVRDGRVTLYTRRGLDAATYFPELAGPVAWADAREAVLDGEVVALGPGGEPDFGLLQARRSAGRRASGEAPLAYVAFDLLYLDGRLLLDEPLEERKRLLRSILRDGGPAQFSSHVVGDGEAFYQAVSDRGLEGIMAKRRLSRYEAGRRSTSWLKIKRRSEQEFVVGGWVPRESSENDLGALMLGVFEGGSLRPVGKAGTGFDARERRRLLDRMTSLARQSSPFRPVPRERGARWVEPHLVARVEFLEWTSDGQLRAPVYKGLEIDADPAGVTRERARHVEVTATAGGAGESGPRPAATADAGRAGRFPRRPPTRPRPALVPPRPRRWPPWTSCPARAGCGRSAAGSSSCRTWTRSSGPRTASPSGTSSDTTRPWRRSCCRRCRAGP